jgi:hypothetical protein
MSTGECTPTSRWIKADRLHPLIPRETPRFTALYRPRAAVEREFGRLENEWSLTPLRVRGLDRVRLNADLTILAKLPARSAEREPYRSRRTPLHRNTGLAVDPVRLKGALPQRAGRVSA